MNFVEHLSIANREEVFSSAIAWLFGEDSPLNLEQKLSIIGEAFQVDENDVTGIKIERELGKIDIVIFLLGNNENPIRRIAIENKINATESPGQLHRYTNWLNAHEANVPTTKIYLTVAGEAAQAEDWVNKSYLQLGLALGQIINNAPADPADCGYSYVLDLHTAIMNLGNLPNVVGNSSLAHLAFGETTLVELENANVDDDTNANVDDDTNANVDDDTIAMARYVNAAKLQRLFQRQWMWGLSNYLEIQEGWSFDARSESHQQSILNIQRNINIQHPDLIVAVGVQVQRRTVKFFCRPEPYPRAATYQQHLVVFQTIAQFPDILPQWLHDQPQPEPPVEGAVHGRGFRSYTIEFVLPENRDLEAWGVALNGPVNDFQNALQEAGLW